MARVGEGDPRWLVEDREDWANVNNWHWAERDVSEWAFAKIKSLFVDTEFSTEENVLKITSAVVHGLATINVRKGKINSVYDFKIELHFEVVKESDEAVKGTIKIPEFDFETGYENISCSVSFEKIYKDMEHLRGVISQGCLAQVKERLKEFLRLLDIHCNLIKLPQRKDKPNPPSLVRMPVTQTSAPTLECHDTKTLVLEEEFNCPSSFLFEVFTQVEKICAYMGSPTEFEPRIGGSFAFLDSNITGKVLEMVNGAKLVLSWRFKNWPEDYYSRVHLSFKDFDGATKLDLVHENVPSSDFDRVSEGWERYFFLPIKRMFGIGGTHMKTGIF